MRRYLCGESYHYLEVGLKETKNIGETNHKSDLPFKKKDVQPDQMNRKVYKPKEEKQSIFTVTNCG